MIDQFSLGPEFKGFKKMLRKDLAADLGISGAMVSKLAKRGMPTDSLERAQRWRKRHLEPGRVKGSRFDPNYTAPPAPEPAAPPPAAPTPPSAADVARKLTREAEVAAKCVGIALRVDGLASIPPLIAELRDGLRELPDGADPAMPVRVWVALLDWALLHQAGVRSYAGQDEVMGALEFGALVDALGGSGHLNWLHDACDWNDWSLMDEAEFDEDGEE